MASQPHHQIFKNMQKFVEERKKEDVPVGCVFALEHNTDSHNADKFKWKMSYACHPLYSKAVSELAVKMIRDKDVE